MSTAGTRFTLNGVIVSTPPQRLLSPSKPCAALSSFASALRVSLDLTGAGAICLAILLAG
jgi:hypothetical protein